MPLSGSSVPLDHGGFVVTVVCPNHYSHQRLMQALLSIVPDAGEPVAQPATIVAHHATLQRDPEQEDDTGSAFPDYTQCRVEGGCE